MIDSKINQIILSTDSKFQKLSKILKYLFVDIAQIDQTKYYILGSYALREHRHINDLDINLEQSEFYKLKKVIDMGFGSIEIYNNQIRWFFDMTNEYCLILGNHKETDFSSEAFSSRIL